MNDISIIEKSITRILDRYIEENHFKDDFEFSFRIAFSAKIAMFNLMMKTGELRGEVIKSVYPVQYLLFCNEDDIVKNVCDSYKDTMTTYINSQKKSNVNTLTQ